MFYNSKKLVDEKVLQQYYFEKLMGENSSIRKKFLPSKYEIYASESIVKGINAEVNIGPNSKPKKNQTTISNHTTDFILYPSEKSKLNSLNIEIKWNIKDFEQEEERFWHYNGEKNEGFVVAIYNEEYHPEYIDDGKIPVVYICPEEFKKWFTKKAYLIISQSLSNKLGFKPSRLTGEKFWIIAIVESSKKHYLEQSRKNNVWAFRDNRNPKNIMNILDEDYVLFIKLNHCCPGRAIYPFSKKITTQFKKSRKDDSGKDVYLNTNEISWSIDLVDIRKVKKGYHLNYSDKSPYNVFDENWMKQEVRLENTKDYTQFITFQNNSNDEFEYFWDKPLGLTLDRTMFLDTEYDAVEFVDSLRTSYNSGGDAVEISRNSFMHILNLLN